MSAASPPPAFAGAPGCVSSLELLILSLVSLGNRFSISAASFVGGVPRASLEEMSLASFRAGTIG